MTDQLSLIPEKLVSPKARKVVLTTLPEELSGPEPDQSFIESVQKFGILQPIGLIEKEGEYQVAYGRRRIKAARSLGLISIPSLIFPLGWTPASVLTLVENTHRTDNLAAKLEAIAELRLSATPEEICAAVGVSEKELNEAIKLLNDLTPELQEAMKEGRIKTTTAKKAAKLPQAQQQELAKQDKIKSKDVDQYLQAQTRQRTEASVLFDEGREEADGETNDDFAEGGFTGQETTPVPQAVKSSPASTKLSKSSWKLQAKPLVEQLMAIVPESEEEVHQYLELLSDVFKTKH